MYRVKSVVLVVLTALSCAIQASPDDSYSSQLTVDAATGTKQYSDFRLAYEAYFERLDLDVLPLESVAFKSKASSASVEVVSLEDLGGTRTGIELTYRGVVKSNGLLIDLLYSGGLNDDFERTLSFDVGKYINDSSTLTVGFERVDPLFIDKNRIETWRARTEYVGGQTDNYRFAFELGVVNYEAEELDSEVLAGFDTAVYPTKTLSVELGASITTRTLRSVVKQSTSDPDPTVEENLMHYYVGIGWFVMPEIELSIEYSKTDNIAEYSAVAKDFLIIDREIFSFGLLWRI